MAKKLGGEVVNVGRVVGAEKERAALEDVIVRRAKLLGEDPELKLGTFIQMKPVSSNLPLAISHPHHIIPLTIYLGTIPTLVHPLTI